MCILLCLCIKKYLASTKPILLNSTLEYHKLFLIEAIRAVFENITHSYYEQKPPTKL